MNKDSEGKLLANFCPTCGSKCELPGVCSYHGKIIFGPSLRVCLNGHIVGVLEEPTT